MESQEGRAFEQLTAGLNRIRFIQKRQASNHHLIANHLSQIIARFKPHHPHPDPHRRTVQLASSLAHDQAYLSRTQSSRQRFKLSPRGKYAVQTTQEDSCVTRAGTGEMEESSETGSSQRVREEKTANYRAMKERETEVAELLRLRSEATQQLLRDRVAKAGVRRLEGRRRVEDNYFDRIDGVHAEKQRAKQRRNRESQRQQQQVALAQQEESEQIEQFESSLVVEDQLRWLIRRLPRAS